MPPSDATKPIPCSYRPQRKSLRVSCHRKEESVALKFTERKSLLPKIPPQDSMCL